jgi:DNA-binding FrmR family transcriptional regulator
MKKGTDQTDKLVALKRIEGQVRGLQKMIQEGRYCIDVLNAAEAVIGALRNVEAGILKDHLGACVKHAFEGRSKKEQEIKLDEIYRLFKGMRK